MTETELAIIAPRLIDVVGLFRVTLGYGFIRHELVGQLSHCRYPGDSIKKSVALDGAHRLVSGLLGRNAKNYFSRVVYSPNGRVIRRMSFDKVGDVYVVVRDMDMRTINPGLEFDIINDDREVLNVDIATNSGNVGELRKVLRRIQDLGTVLEVLGPKSPAEYKFPESLMDSARRFDL